MPPDEAIALHHSWRQAMRIAWREQPILTFLTTKGNAIVAIGGWAKPDTRPVNDNIRSAER